MTDSVMDGEDIVQEALFEAYRKLDQYDESRPLKPWLFGIAHNRCIVSSGRRVRRPVGRFSSYHRTTPLRQYGSRVLRPSRVPEEPFCKPRFRRRPAQFRNCQIRQRPFLAAGLIRAGTLYSTSSSKTVRQTAEVQASLIARMPSARIHPKPICMQLPNSLFSCRPFSIFAL